MRKFTYKTVKACVRYFPFFHQMIALQKLWKMLLFNLKSFFHSQDTQIFVFPSCPLFPSVSHCLRRWLKINPTLYDVITWLNKNLKTHIVWYFVKETRSDIETWSTDRVWSKEYFYIKSMQKMCTKSTFFFTLNSPKQPTHARNSFGNKIFWKRIIKNL